MTRDRDTEPAPPSFDEATGVHHEIPGFVGEPPPFRLPHFPEENSLLHEKLESLTRNEQALDQAVLSLEASIASVASTLQSLKGTLDLLHDDLRGLRLTVESELSDLKRRVGELERWRRSLDGKI